LKPKENTCIHAEACAEGEMTDVDNLRNFAASVTVA
jgi:hypothetical protein